MTPDEFKHVMIQLDLVGISVGVDTVTLAGVRIYVSTKYNNMYLYSDTRKWPEVSKEDFDNLLKQHVEQANG